MQRKAAIYIRTSSESQGEKANHIDLKTPQQQGMDCQGVF